MEYSAILNNAVDSLEMGVNFYIINEHEAAYKHAILSIFHSIELLLKERLYRVNEILIYRNIDAPITDDSLTVGLAEIITRFKNLGFPLPRKDIAILKELQRKRNHIEHHRYVQDPDDFFVIGKALGFAHKFMRQQLDLDPEDILGTKLDVKVRETVLEYEERLQEAETEINRLMELHKKAGSESDLVVTQCPDCFNETVVVGSDRGDFCFFCRLEMDIEVCDYCGGYFPAEEIDDTGNCMECYAYRLSKF